MDDQELIELRQRQLAAREAFLDTQQTFLNAQHAYLDASHSSEVSPELRKLAQATLLAAEPYTAALVTLREVLLQAVSSQERDAEVEQLEKLQQALAGQLETFRQIVLQPPVESWKQE